VFWRETYRSPDFAKWTRPRAWCPRCRDVRAVFMDKRPGVRRTMRYGQQYRYRCPHTTCRGGVVAPYALPAATLIDWTVPGRRIGERAEPLKPKTLHRMRTGLAAYGAALLTPAGGTWNTQARPVGEPMRARTTRETEALVCPPLLVPVEGRPGMQARPVAEPMRAQTGRAENALVIPLRNNGVAKPATGTPLLTFAAGVTHHGLLYGYDTGTLRPAHTVPLPAQTTVDGDALLRPATATGRADVDACTFRMLTVDEIRAGMAFTPGYRLLGTAKRAKVRMLGNAVTPPARPQPHGRGRRGHHRRGDRGGPVTAPAAGLRVVSYGGGVQSTALLVLAATGRIDFGVFLFANVGDDSEDPGTLDYLHRYAKPYAALHGIQLHELHRLRRDGSTETLYGRLTQPGSRSLPIPVRMSNGAPGTRSCTADFKIKVIGRWLGRAIDQPVARSAAGQMVGAAGFEPATPRL
jgi:hypothetical protein